MVNVPSVIVEQVLTYIRDAITIGVDRMKTNKEPVPVILCGGGSILIDPKQSFDGVTEVTESLSLDIFLHTSSSADRSPTAFCRM